MKERRIIKRSLLKRDVEGRSFYEREFVRILSLLTAEGAILSWQETKRCSPRDAMGIDFLVWTEEGKVVPFQVTSEYRAANKRRQKMREKNFYVPIICLRKGRRMELKPIPQVIEETLGAIAGYLEASPEGYQEKIL